MKKRTLKPQGRSETEFVLGRHAFARISAIEGIHISASIDADFREFERKGLSAPQRRHIIAKKYGKDR